MVMANRPQETQVVVVGGGPGGYVAAIRAADLGSEVVLIEEREQLGGVCLLEGCIPSKTLIHAVETLEAAQAAKKMGLTFSELQIDPAGLRQFTAGVVGDLSRGVAGLLKKRNVTVLRGRARFESNQVLSLAGADPPRIRFRHCILATGSRAARLPGDESLGLWSNVDATALPEIPETLLVVGGGYIGLELGLVYAGLGSKVTVVELLPSLLTGADPDLVQVVQRSAAKKLKEILLETKIAGIEKSRAGYTVRIDAKGQIRTQEFAKILVAVGRQPNTDDLGLGNTRIVSDSRGFIPVNERQETAEPSIYAIGDITPGPMLAHKASAQGKVAAEVIAQRPAAFEPRAIPAVVFTHPEMAWTGLSETVAKARGIAYEVGKFPLGALGRAKGMGMIDGFAKVLADPHSGLVLGAAIVGPHASDLIVEATLAVEMGATLEDLIATIHPHPTLSELTQEAAEVAFGTAVHIFAPKKKG